MSIDLTRERKTETFNNEATSEANQKTHTIVPYDMKADRKSMNELVGSKEIDDIASQISVYDQNSIVTFGAKTAENISKSSEAVLNNMNMAQLNATGDMMKSLSKIMSKFDIDEIKQDDSKNPIVRLFRKGKNSLEAILEKYETMGDEVKKIHTELKKYEAEIQDSNRKLEDMFTENVNYYHELVKYIFAGEQGCKEIREYIDQRQKDLEQTGDNSIRFEIESLNQSLDLLEQRVQDLRIAEKIAMQSVPMIRTMEYTNANLIRKINSAFIITLPVFTQSLAQAILLKRQKIQADSMNALDEKTNELLRRNAENSVEQMKTVAKMSSGSSIKIETLEYTWNTIMTGIADTKQIQDEVRAERERDKEKLLALKNQIYNA